MLPDGGGGGISTQQAGNGHRRLRAVQLLLKVKRKWKSGVPHQHERPIKPLGVCTDCSYNASMTSRISAREFHRSIGEVSKRARREPVVITNQGDDDLVLLSATEYARLQRSERRVHLTSEFPDDLLELVKQSRMDPSHAHLDDELAGWTP